MKTEIAMVEARQRGYGYRAKKVKDDELRRSSPYW